MKYDVIVVAAGKGNRAALGYNKAFFMMNNNKTVLENSCQLFIKDNDCQNIIIVTNKENYNLVFKDSKVKLTEGGLLRKDSVNNGLKLVNSEYVLIHDAARPYLHIEALEKLKNILNDCDAVILAHVSIDTVKYVENNKIIKTIDRKKIYLAETPQGFKSELIQKCYKENIDKEFTDEASLLEELGYDVYVVNDEHENKKLTYKEDFIHD